MQFVECMSLSAILFVILALIGYLIGQIKKYITLGLDKIIGTKLTLFIINRLTFIGTIHHELAHALFAMLSGAKVTKIRLIEFRGGRLGSVEYIPRGNIITKSIQHTFSAYAPVVCGFITEVIMLITFNNTNNIWIIILKMYIMFSVFVHMTMSKQDIKMCLMGLPICITIVAIILMFFGIRFTDIVLLTNLILI